MMLRYLLAKQPDGLHLLADRERGVKIRLRPGTAEILQDGWSAQSWHDFTQYVFEQDSDFQLPLSHSKFHRQLYSVQYSEGTETATVVDAGLAATTVLMRSGLQLDPRCLCVPLRVYLGVYNSCNLQCTYCCASSSKRRPGYLSVEEVEKIARFLYRVGVVEIRLGESGEPTQHPEFEEVVKRIKENGLYLSLNTNGVIDDERRRDFITQDGKVDLLIVSLDGIGEAHDRNRGEGTYQAAFETIRSVAKQTRLRFNYVVNNQTMHSLEQLADLADQYGAEIYTLPMRPSGRAAKGFERYLDGLCWEDLIDRMQQLRQKYPRLRLYSTYDVHTPSGDHLVDHAGSCPAGVEGCCLSPVVEQSEEKPTRIRMFGCTFLADACGLGSDGQFIASIFDNVDDLENRFFDVWQTGFEVFRGKTYKDDTCKRCEMLRNHRCTGHCTAIGFYRTRNPGFDPSIYCALGPSSECRPML